MEKQDEKESIELTDEELKDVSGGRPGDAWQQRFEEEYKKKEEKRKNRNK